LRYFGQCRQIWVRLDFVPLFSELLDLLEECLTAVVFSVALEKGWGLECKVLRYGRAWFRFLHFYWVMLLWFLVFCRRFKLQIEFFGNLSCFSCLSLRKTLQGRYFSKEREELEVEIPTMKAFLYSIVGVRIVVFGRLRR